MTASYSGDPATSELDAIRYLIGDTSVSDALVSDEEIQYSLDKFLPLYGTEEWVAASILDTLAARYAREASFAADGVNVTLAGLQEQFSAQAEKLRSQHKSLFVGALVDVGGIDAYEQPDTSVKPTAFGTGMHDNRAAGLQEPGGGNADSYGYPDVADGY